MSPEQAYLNGFIKRAAKYGFSSTEALGLYKQASATVGDTVYGTVGKQVENAGNYLGNVASNKMQDWAKNAPAVYRTAKPYLRAADKTIDTIDNLIPSEKGKTISTISNAANTFENAAHKLDPIAKPIGSIAQKGLDKAVNVAENIPQPIIKTDADQLQKDLGKHVVNSVAYPVARNVADIFVPGAGGVVSAAHAAKRMADGDSKGAWIDRASGVLNAASVYPPLYPYAKPASMLLNGVNFARDLSRTAEPVMQKIEPAKQMLLKDLRKPNIRSNIGVTGTEG